MRNGAHAPWEDGAGDYRNPGTARALGGPANKRYVLAIASYEDATSGKVVDLIASTLANSKLSF